MVRMSTTPALFLETLHVINAILHENAQRPPFNELLARAREVLGDHHITVAVYQGDPSVEIDHFMMRLVGDEFDLVMRGRDSDVIDLFMSHDYLEQVVDRQEEYLENPRSLDWSWLEDLTRGRGSRSEPGV